MKWICSLPWSLDYIFLRYEMSHGLRAAGHFTTGISRWNLTGTKNDSNILLKCMPRLGLGGNSDINPETMRNPHITALHYTSRSLKTEKKLPANCPNPMTPALTHDSFIMIRQNKLQDLLLAWVYSNNLSGFKGPKSHELLMIDRCHIISYNQCGLERWVGGCQSLWTDNCQFGDEF